jgi:hypothetical protein
MVEKTAPKAMRPRPWMRGGVGDGAEDGWAGEGMISGIETDRRPGENRPAAMSLFMIFREGD